MRQSWQKLLFAHWALPVEAVRPLIPEPLELETFDGMAWIGVVPFLMNHVRWRITPPIPTTHRFPELNVRTYVRFQEKSGVWFFSLDARSQLAVRTARRLFHLPYYDADMFLTHHHKDWLMYDSRRTHRGAKSADFVARYRPTSAVYYSEPDTLEEWLTERYCLYAVDPLGMVYRGEIHHEKWRLQKAEAEISVNSMLSASRLRLPDEAPLLHYVENIDVVAWYPVRC